MFNKINEIRKIKEIQKSLKEEKVTVEDSGIKLILNGNIELEEIHLSQEISKEEQERVIIKLFNEALKKIQMKAAQKMSQMGGF